MFYHMTKVQTMKVLMHAPKFSKLLLTTHMGARSMNILLGSMDTLLAGREDELIMEVVPLLIRHGVLQSDSQMITAAIYRAKEIRNGVLKTLFMYATRLCKSDMALAAKFAKASVIK